MQSTITDELSAINKSLAEKVGSQKYRIWFKNSTKLILGDGYLKVGVPNLFIANWIENHFSKEITQAVQEVTGDNCKIAFTIDPELSGHQRRTQLYSQPQLAAGTCNSKNGVLEKANPDVMGTALTGNINNSRKGGVNEVTQRLRRKQLKMSFETFVVGSSNELAYNAAKAIVNDKQSPFNPLFFHGGYGVGKTHLLQGICTAVSKNRPETNWLYMSAEDFANQFVLALKTRKLEAFRRRMRQTDLLAIDDIHFLASKPSTQEEFLHTFNTVDLAGKQVVLASDAHPKMIGQLSEKLVNRFVSGMVVKIDTPDFETRCQICKQYAKSLRKHVPESVIEYIAESLQSNVRELQGAIVKLIAYSALQNQKINIFMTKEILAEHLARIDPIVHISDIESSVAAFFDITPAELHSSRKDRTVALARHFSMYLARKHTKMSSPEIGRFMGNKNHATVLLACKKIEDYIKRNVELHWHSSVGNKVSKARTVLSHLEENVSK